MNVIHNDKLVKYLRAYVSKLRNCHNLIGVRFLYGESF